MPNIAENLNEAAKILQVSGVNEPRRQAASLLALALGRDKTFIVARPEYEMTEPETTRYHDFLRRRAAREPFQHIAGKQEFYGLDFVVSKDVLIPRPETETIVETAIEILGNRECPRFCEVGVGSGCISIAILHAVEKASAVGLDVSEKALRIAAVNARRHNAADRLTLRISDVFAVLQNERFDLIVSNPPYIPAADIAGLEPEVRDFEPLAALTDGADGFSVIRRIIEAAPRFLKPGGWLLLEIGFGQARNVRRMFAPVVWKTIEILPDLQGIPRTIKARLRSNQPDEV